jgi:hypothetical protein
MSLATHLGASPLPNPIIQPPLFRELGLLFCSGELRCKFATHLTRLQLTTAESAAVTSNIGRNLGMPFRWDLK